MKKFHAIKNDPHFDYNVPLIKKLANMAYIILGLAALEFFLIFILTDIDIRSIAFIIMGGAWFWGYKKYIKKTI